MVTPAPLIAVNDASEPAAIELAATSESISKTAPKHDSDPYLVTFDEPFDAENPLDWRKSRKWLVTDVMSATGFNRIMVSTIMAPALPIIQNELSMNSTEAAMSMSIYLLATAFGPLVIGPLSEIYGRNVILHSTNVWFLVWNIVCGFAETKGTLIAARFLAGFGASAVYSLAGGVLGDVWRKEERGKTMGIYMLIPLLGAAVGPVIGGFITVRTTWRWMFWATSIFQAVMTLVAFSSFQETYAPVILERRAAKLRKETGESGYHTLFTRLRADRSTTQVLQKALTRPLRLLFFHPIIQIQAIIAGFSYGLLYLVLSTFAGLWMTQYGESIEISSLHYIALSLAEVCSALISGRMSDSMYKRSDLENRKLETRILVCFPSSVIGFVGVVMYGWLAQVSAFWLSVDIGAFIMLFGLAFGGTPLTAYVIDVYEHHSSSALAATQFAKSMTAFLFPLFAPSMYARLGFGWGNTLIGIAGFLVTVPLQMMIYRKGEQWRSRAISTY